MVSQGVLEINICLLFMSDLTSKYWKIFKKIADDRKNDEIIFINCDFQQFSSLIPDLTALSPAENLHENMKKLFGGTHA